MMSKKSLILSVILLSLGASSFNAFARVVLFINPQLKTGADLCQSVKGTWEGRGKLGSIFTDCIYEGTAKISGNETIVLDTNFKKVTGPEWCKPKFNIQLTGVCENNIMDWSQQNVHLSGTTLGKSVQLEGTLDLALNTYVEIDMRKKS